tara:strand:- start:2170 stop:3342 length:1173 start_codon:yes stop_codon:yes gene_type:complete
MSKIFRRPMFRKGGNVGDGIMTGIVDRTNHAEDPFVGGTDQFPYSFDRPQPAGMSPYEGRTIPSLKDLTAESTEALLEAAGPRGGFDPLTSFLLAYGPSAAVEDRGGGTIGNLIAAAEKPVQALIKEKADEDKFQRGIRTKATGAAIAQRNQMIAEEADRKFKTDLAIAQDKLNRDLSIEEQKFLMNKSIRDAKNDIAELTKKSELQTKKEIDVATALNKLVSEEPKYTSESFMKDYGSDYISGNRAKYESEGLEEKARKTFKGSYEGLIGSIHGYGESTLNDSSSKTWAKKNLEKIFYDVEDGSFKRLRKTEDGYVYEPINIDTYSSKTTDKDINSDKNKKQKSEEYLPFSVRDILYPTKNEQKINAIKRKEEAAETLGGVDLSGIGEI